MSAPTSNLRELVERFPLPDEDGKFSNPDKSAMNAAVVEMQRGGRDNVLAVVELLVEREPAEDLRPRHLLHAWATYAGSLADAERATFTSAVAEALTTDRPIEIKSFLIRQLQVAGGREVTPQLGALLRHEELVEPAAQALVAIGDGAAREFRGALAAVQGRSRRTIVQSLGVLADKEAAEILRAAVRDEDRDVRQAALWALARVGDAQSVDLLLEAAQVEGIERVQAADACLQLAENLLEAGNKQAAEVIYRRLRDTRTSLDEQYVREAADRGLVRAR